MPWGKKMRDKYRMVFSGSGGQGIITAAVIISEAAVLYENLNAVQTQSYGPAARGGSSRSDVIISKSEIFFPKVIQPNTLICLTQAAYNEFSGIVRPGGILITDSKYVSIEKKVDADQIEIPIYDTVKKEIGNPVVFNICLLGVIIKIKQIVKKESIIKVMEQRIPAGFLNMNIDAIELGMSMTSAIKNEI